MLFNGPPDLIDCGELELTGNITICTWVRAYSFGENGVGRIFDNSKMMFRLHDEGRGRVELASNGWGTFARTADGSFPDSLFNSWVSLFATRAADGTANIYIDGVSKTAAVNSGVPGAGSTNLLIGNNNAGNAAFNGIISYARIYKRLLEETDLLQIYKDEKKKYYS